MKIPLRPAPPIPEQTNQNYYVSSSGRTVRPVQLPQKKPPPRPPPPKLNNVALYERAPANGQGSSSSNWYINKKTNLSSSLIDLNSPPKETKYLNVKTNNNFTETNLSLFNKASASCFDVSRSANVLNLTEPQTQVNIPTIIRAQVGTRKKPSNFDLRNVEQNDVNSNSYSPPMPTIPPPSPPKCIDDQWENNKLTPYGIALSDYTPTHKDDLQIQVNDVVEILNRINDEWLYGRVGNRKGMFPANFINIQVPLPYTEDFVATALYEFNPQTTEDLKLTPNQKIRIIRRISNDWLYGESNGNYGQFPENFVDTVPGNI